MPLSAEAQREEKVIAKQAAADEKNLKHVMKHVDHAEKAEASHAKAVDKAIHAHEKSIKIEHKMAGKLAKAERAHDSAVYNIQDNDKAIRTKQHQLVEMTNEHVNAKANLEQFKQKKESNDQLREERLAQLHNNAAANISAHSTLSTNAPHQ